MLADGFHAKAEENKFFSKFLEEKNRDIFLLKEDINKEFIASKRKFLIIIDDIDRLTNKEIRDIFQIVKSNADFKNVIYLLAFQRDIIERALGEEFTNKDDDRKKEEGKKYLEKIVPFGLDIPEPKEDKVREFLVKSLNDIKVNFGYEVSEMRQNYIIEFVFPYFRTLRHAKRFINSYQFYLSMFFIEKGIIEVEPLDFMAIETIRLFEPDVYRNIYLNKYELIGTDFNRWKATGDSKRVGDIFIKDLIDFKDDLHFKKNIAGILCNLFPGIEPMIERITKMHSGYTLENDVNWHSTHRISVPEYFDLYFQFSTPDPLFSRKHFIEVKGKFDDRKALKSHMDKLREQKYLYEFMQAFREYIFEDSIYGNKNELEKLKNFILVLFDMESDINYKEWIANNRFISEFYGIVKDYPFIKVLDPWHYDLIKDSNTMLHALAIIKECECDELKQVIQDRLETFVKSDDFREHPLVLSILRYWGRVFGDDRPKEVFQKFIKDDEGLRKTWEFKFDYGFDLWGETLKERTKERIDHLPKELKKNLEREGSLRNDPRST